MSSTHTHTDKCETLQGHEEVTDVIAGMARHPQLGAHIAVTVVAAEKSYTAILNPQNAFKLAQQVHQLAKDAARENKRSVRG